MKSAIIYKNTLSNVDLDFLDAEPFSKREALNWLMTKTNDANSKIHLSARHIAGVWKWHRSKVERFLKVLKEKGLIETAIETDKTSLIPCNSKFTKEYESNTKTGPETIIGTNIDFNGLKTSERDNFETAIDHSQTPSKPSISLASASY